jgi:hypothetical protein
LESITSFLILVYTISALKNVANETSVRAIYIAIRPLSSAPPSSGTIPLHPKTAEIRVLESRKQLKRERIFDPILVNDRCDLALRERAHLTQRREFLGRRFHR